MRIAPVLLIASHIGIQHSPIVVISIVWYQSTVPTQCWVLPSSLLGPDVDALGGATLAIATLGPCFVAFDLPDFALIAAGAGDLARGSGCGSGRGGGVFILLDRWHFHCEVVRWWSRVSGSQSCNPESSREGGLRTRAKPRFRAELRALGIFVITVGCKKPREDYLTSGVIDRYMYISKLARLD